MAIVVDQTRLHTISRDLLGNEPIDRAQALAIVNIAQLAAGAAPSRDPQEHTILQAVAQHVSALGGVELDEVMAIPRAGDARARRAMLQTLARDVRTRRARELAYALAFIVSVADLELAASESSALEELQHALDVDHRRATDLTMFVTGRVDSEVQIRTSAW